ncbi:AAA family ATPase [Mycolicibacterium fortuitum]|uniref:AAA family ATPase n=1 Tax=Mycolicibacterium fortuitum TaxID=1766 RepID=UPI0007EB7223|nr:AAA family ATPase [Mycolicibacterium fortuitum]OBG50175.1 hypothetical protein A5670_26395 [Mycolicibacterium fortuitum]
MPEPTGSAPDVTEVDSFTDDTPQWSPGAESAPGWHADDGAAFILDQPRNIPPVWGEGERVLWAEGESLMIAAGMGTGKTTLAGQLVRAQLGIGDGLVFDLPVVRASGPILYLAMDRPRQIARSLARQFAEADRDALKSGLIVRSGPPIADLAESPKLLAHMAEHYGAAVVYVDSLKDAAVGLSDDKVGAGYNRARQNLMAAGVQLCELHHVVKRNPNGGPPSSIADVYGSTWLTSGTGSVIFLAGDPGDPIVGFRHLRQPAEVVGPFMLTHDHETGQLAIDPEETVDLLALAFDSEPDGLTARTAAMAVFETREPTRGQVEQMRRALDRLARVGELVEINGRRGGAPNGRTATAWHPVHHADAEGEEPDL